MYDAVPPLLNRSGIAGGSISERMGPWEKRVSCRGVGRSVRLVLEKTREYARSGRQPGRKRCDPEGDSLLRGERTSSVVEGGLRFG